MRARGDAGFTLTEATIAVFLFLATLVAAGGLFSAISTEDQRSALTTTSDLELKRHIQEIYRTEWAALAPGRADTVLPDGILVRTSWDVIEVVPNELKEARLTVRALSGRVEERRRSVRLFLARR